MNEITDRELLAICNLSNLKMEFSNLVESEKTETIEIDGKKEAKKIVTNHTIYSLLEKECNGLKIREDWEKKWREENPLKISPDESKRNYEAEKYKEKFSEERRNRFSKDTKNEYGAFYDIGDDEEKTYEYWHKIDLQKSAPIIMEYFDRYNLALDKKSHEGKFLEDWEVIYGGDFYQILLDYAFKTHQEYSKESEKCKDIEEYIKKKQIPSRKDLLSKEEKIEFLNIIWDFATALAGINNVFQKLGTINNLKMAFENLEYRGVIKEIYEAATGTKIKDEDFKNFKDEKLEEIRKILQKKAFELKGTINFKVVDFRIVILRKKGTNKYVVSFYNSKDNMIIESFEKGALNLDLILVNEVIENEIRKISKNENVEIIYTGYEYGALMAFSSHSIFNTLFNQNPDNVKIQTFSKVFVGEKKYNFGNFFNVKSVIDSIDVFDFEKLINFDIKKLTSVQPGSVEYTKNVLDSLSNMFSMCLVNIAGTKGVCLATVILLKGGTGTLIYSVLTSVAPVVYIAIFISYFIRSEKYRNEMEQIEKKMLECKIVENKGKYTIVNKEFNNYSSALEINKRNGRKIILKSTVLSPKLSDILIVNEPLKTEPITPLKKDAKLYPVTIEIFNEESRNSSYEKNKMTINVPREVVIALCFSYCEISKDRTIKLYKNGFEGRERYELKLDLLNNFISIEEVFEENWEEENYKIITTPKFEEEGLFDYVLYLMTIIQNKYDFENKIFENSEFIYMKQLEITEEEKDILDISRGHDENEKSRYSFEEEALLKDEYRYELSVDNSLNTEKEIENLNKEIYAGEGGYSAERRQSEKFVPRYDKIPYYTELTKIDQYEVVSVDHNDNLEYRENTNVEEINNFKLTPKKIKPLIKIDNFEKKKFIYAKRIPTLTKKLDEIEHINYVKSAWFENKTPYNEYIYFPYVELGGNGEITENIREDYIGSILRSSFRRELKYDSLDEEQKDIFFGAYPLSGEDENKSEKLNKHFIQKIKIQGQNLGYPEHYNSVMKLLESNPKLIENYYTLQELDKRIPTKNLKIGILNGNEYALDKIGFIYNEDDIYGRAIDFIYNYGSGAKLEEISTYGVCQGAKLWCSAGDTAGSLLVSSQNFEYTDGFLDATKDDCKAITNITPFGSCACNKKKPCINYISLGKWSDTSSGTETNNKKAILSTGTISCKEGGKITIINPNCKLHNN
ncbi:DUF4280 domain-containing protein [uncultured Fusobacterium sp.]|uniref:DUF4280 domain-containing protein n=1 Tax=uncultured Fusobacterium sp. TaxID=159267 RepID=UPI0025D2B81A|nr:DUF4280 domain-containing protein [uncultured Fusobacterium sp.]